MPRANGGGSSLDFDPTQRAPRTKQEEQRSSMDMTQYPDPKFTPRKAEPIPNTRDAQNKSSAFPMPDYKAPPKEAWVEPKRENSKFGQQQSSVFGASTPRQQPQKNDNNNKPAAGNPSNRAAQQQSSVFGTPREHTPASKPSSAQPQKNPTSKAEMNQSSVFGTPRHTQPPERPKQEATDVFGGSVRQAPTQPAGRKSSTAKEAPAATSTNAQLASSVFGTPRNQSASRQQTPRMGNSKDDWLAPEPPKKHVASSKDKYMSYSLPGTVTVPPPRISQDSVGPSARSPSVCGLVV